MNLILLTAQIQYFLLNREGMSDEQITAMRSNVNFTSEIVPLIKSVASRLEANGQNVDTIQNNKNLLVGVIANTVEVKA